MKTKNRLATLLAVATASTASVLLVAPAQAIEITPGSNIGFTFTDGNFLDQIGQPTLSIDINTPGRISFATGDFASIFDLSAGDEEPSSFSNNFELTLSGSNPGSGTSSDPWRYLVNQEERFHFNTPEGILEFVIPAGTNFVGISSGTSAELELCDVCFGQPFWRHNGDTSPATSTLQLGVSGLTASSQGSGTSEVVPEPTTILGTMVVLGFGGFLKNQKNKQNN
ncbi:MAG: PEP-CTERM sorting domain-containing protein [Gloeocapsa sp. DLM2.Bin57]|nr:MAG: PEP-CTERM sorting domain-containing protein [Gloeocapsa sp. DLM2.Bin57]